MTAVRRVDADGIHWSEAFTGSAEVFFGDARAWSLQASEATHTPWPRALRKFLAGWTRVRIVVEDEPVFAERVAFTDEDCEISMIDRYGDLVMVDKWGLIQRPFEGRSPEFIASLVDCADNVLRELRERCGIEGWIAFGTLLGAARSGGAIGHDSDIDLCYLSRKRTPAEVSRELWGIGRALRDAGFDVVHKNGSFLTVEMTHEDGGVGTGVDLYVTFFEGGLLYESATVRAPMDETAIMPLTTIEFEGRRFPAPADVSKILEVSYGPGWRVPDPTFKHQPGPEINSRFHQWFGSLWRGRRAWRAANTGAVRSRQVSPFAEWVAARLAPEVRVVDVGAGTGADLRFFRESGHPVLGLDYALPRRGFPAGQTLNLYDRRDVLARGALMARYAGPQVFYARRVLETLDEAATDNFWSLVRMGLRRGGTVYLESIAWSPEQAAQPEVAEAPLRTVLPADVAAAAERHGGVVSYRRGFAAAEYAAGHGGHAEWRMIVEWPDLTVGMTA